MEITVKARNAEIHPNFRDYVEEKISKVEQLAPRTQSVDVELTHEKNPRQADTAERIEITVHGKGPVVRAEASSSDRYAAVDIAAGKLYERLRRARDRMKNHRRYESPPDVELDVELPKAEEAPAQKAPLKPGEVREDQLGDSPVIVREKLHATRAMSVEEALDEMELVGHHLGGAVGDLQMDAGGGLHGREEGYLGGLITISSLGFLLV